jgi:hypothetical protein
MISGNTLRTLKKQHDKPGKDNDGNPIVRRFHHSLPKTCCFFTHFLFGVSIACKINQKNSYFSPTAGLIVPKSESSILMSSAS